MKKYLLFTILFAGLTIASAQNYTVGIQSVSWTDTTRSNRTVPVEFHYPGTNSSVAADSFGFVVFGHGFDMTIDAYYNYADSLAAHGYIVALTSNEGGLSPSHPNLAQDLIYIYNMMIKQSNVNASSLLYHHVKPKGAIAGHSMGGGCAVLSCQYADTATCYWTLAEATTTPSSITAAPYMHKPYLSFAGSSDCIAPAATNQIPTYDSSASICKTLIEIKNATHCQFALSNIACNFGEGVSGCASTSLSRNGQTDTVLSFLYPYLDYYLNGNCAAWPQFENLYNADVNDALMQSCNNVIPANPTISGATSFCSSSNDLLTAAPAGFIYNWSNNSTAGTLSVISSGTYSVTISNSVCSVTATPFSVSEKFPPNTPQAINAPDTVCSDVANIGISVTNDTTATSYNWTLPSGWNISNGSNTNAVTTTSANTGGILSVTAHNNCGASLPVQKNIFVTPSSLSTPGVILGDTVPCQGLPVQYVIAPVNGASAYTWNYPPDWTLVSGSNIDTLNLVAGNDTGNITLQALNTCTQSSLVSLSVNAHVAPTAGAITGTDSVCINSAGALSFSLPNISNADSIYWLLPVGWNTVSGQNTSNIIVNNNAAAGTITAAVYNVCGSANAIPLTLTIIDTPAATIFQSNDTLATVAGIAYQWYLNSAAISGATKQNYVAMANGNYSVVVTNAESCIGTSALYNYTYLSLSQVAGQNEVAIFPNPSPNGIFQLTINNNATTGTITVFDFLGRQIFEKRITAPDMNIDLTLFTKGIYHAEVLLNGNMIEKNIVIE